ncbi:hypothetical protein [Alicyclobacillus sacchari]|uniref:hypothetical protein n=1 Tax=Alicyclobacillus sacchari TaxID=392010 RepID=UPI0024E08E69|nr:hypothetical protein [Alicyclobacillus sacchari]
MTTYDEKGVRKQFSDKATPERLRAVAQRLAGVAPFTAPVIESSFRALIDELGLKAGQLIHPVRLALTGVTVGPGLFDVIAMLGREETCERLATAANRIDAGTIAAQ